MSYYDIKLVKAMGELGFVSFRRDNFLMEGNIGNDAILVDLKCPRCHTWGFIDDDSLHGRLPTRCLETGCGYDETVDYSQFLKDEERVIVNANHLR
jgi:hypothetical protein